VEAAEPAQCFRISFAPLLMEVTVKRVKIAFLNGIHDEIFWGVKNYFI
jgi:hypothetical protein